jgi:hypothetical protein
VINKSSCSLCPLIIYIFSPSFPRTHLPYPAPFSYLIPIYPLIYLTCHSPTNFYHVFPFSYLSFLSSSFYLCSPRLLFLSTIFPMLCFTSFILVFYRLSFIVLFPIFSFSYLPSPSFSLNFTCSLPLSRLAQVVTCLNLEGCERKQLWHILWYYPEIRQKGVSKTTKKYPDNL